MTSRRFATLAALLALTLAGCATAPPPELHVPPAQAAPWTSLDEARLQHIIAETGELIAQADAAQSIDPMAPRVAGLAARFRSAQYNLATKTEDPAHIRELNLGLAGQFVTATTSFPRTAVVVTEPQADGLPLIMAFVQMDARSNFILTDYTRLLPGVQVPVMKTFDDGSPAVFADTTQLAAAPSDVLSWYADVLTNGAESEHIAAFADDVFQQQVAASRARVVEALGDLGTVAESFAPAEGSGALIGTFDGGALLFGGFTSTTTIELDKSTITLGDLEQALAETDEYGNSMTREWLSTAVFYVPPAGSPYPIQLLGADQILLAVTGD